MLKELKKFIIIICCSSVVTLVFIFDRRANIEKLIANGLASNFSTLDFEELRKISAPIDNYLKQMEAKQLPMLYLITPTYKRSTQIVDLTLMQNTLWSVPNVLWIVVEDSHNKTRNIENFLKNSKLNYVHLYTPTPPDLKNPPHVKVKRKSRGVLQRNEALKWLRAHYVALKHGVVYFADDDNRYDIKLFEEIRTTKKVSIWPVALLSKILYEGPISTNGTDINFFTVLKRKFPIDMAGFSINLKLILDNPNTYFTHDRGQLETRLIENLNQTHNDLELKADNCTMIRVWHTRTKISEEIRNESESELKKSSLKYNYEIIESL